MDEPVQPPTTDTPAACCVKRCRGGATSELAFTPFRLTEKKYKLYELSRREARRQPALPEIDMTDVVQLHNLDLNTEANRRMIHKVVLPAVHHDEDYPVPHGVVEGHEQTGNAAGPSPTSSACRATDNGDGVACYTFAGVPGLLLFPGVLSPEEQQRWCRESVLEFGDSAQHPNILSTHAKTPHATTCYQPPMRWATLGYSYEWTNKVYHRDRFSPFPASLRQRMCDLVTLVGQVKQDGFCCAYPEVYEPQTAIVNYYPVGSMMMCHQDISEEALEQPLMSLSLGCSAIFLMGTQSRDDAPYAFLLRSGDMAAFTGPARTAFHSTPRILDDCPLHLTLPDEGLTEEERQRYHHHAYYAHPTADGSFAPVDKATMTAAEKERYWRLCMRHMRVNINARQVYSERREDIFDEVTTSTAKQCA
jgi:alkylated DNA repair protein alkB homolog 1